MQRQVTLEYEIELAKRVARAPVEREHLGDIMRRLSILAGVRLSKSGSKQLAERINAMMGEEILKESTYIQALIEKWEPVILAKKEAEGKAEGEREMARRMAKHALESKFGTLSNDGGTGSCWPRDTRGHCSPY
jgi:predicted transposase YdaD